MICIKIITIYKLSCTIWSQSLRYTCEHYIVENVVVSLSQLFYTDLSGKSYLTGMGLKKEIKKPKITFDGLERKQNPFWFECPSDSHMFHI